MQLQMPEELVARARSLAEGGDWTAPEARPAATVVLLRDGGEGLEVLLMRRPATMAFAPGMHVFPGGRVDLAHDTRITVHGSVPSGSWADRELARALIVAGVRETFEEAGVLLAVDRSGRPATQDSGWEHDRRVSETAGAFPEVLHRRRLHLDADLLVPLAHWITPEVESRRFDTRFLAAALPQGQAVHAHATETDTAHWLSPGAALAEHRSGERAMLPPTVAVLADLAGHRSVADALAWARSRDFQPLLPRPRVGPDGGVEWDVVDGYSGEVLMRATRPPASEERGTR